MTKKLNIALCGAKGRMGSAIIKEISASSEFKFIGGVDSADTAACFEKLLANSELVIDFSLHSATPVFAEQCAKAHCPFLSGVTGLSISEMSRLRHAALDIPIFWSPNMSPAVNLMSALSGYIAKKLKGFDIHIHETHHNLKKDAPSGTALSIADSIKSACGIMPKVTSARVGGVTGIHNVFFGGAHESLELIHHAQTRALFAAGALFAAKWLVLQKPGFYSFKQLLSLSELI